MPELSGEVDRYCLPGIEGAIPFGTGIGAVDGDGIRCADTLRLNSDDAVCCPPLTFLLQNGRRSCASSSFVEKSNEPSDGLLVGLIPLLLLWENGKYFGSVSFANRRTASLIPETFPTSVSTRSQSRLFGALVYDTCAVRESPA
jgi:hypothetical protein